MKHLGFLLNLTALAMFFPGILMPMFSLNMNLNANIANASEISTDLVDQELSIMQTVEQLWNEDRFLVSFLILFFSVCIPLIKTSIVSIAYFVRSQKLAARLLGFISAIGKWSMADVFVVAIFLAVLSTNHAETATSQQMSVFGFKIAIDVSSQTLSNVGIGFYYFTAYCLLSLAGTHLAVYAVQKNPSS